MEKGGYHLHTA